MVVTAIIALPLASLPGISGGPPSFATQADVDAYFRTFLPSIAATIVLGIVLGPILNAVLYRLGQQYIDGQPPDPVGPGAGDLAWRFFFLGLVYVLLVLASVIGLTIIFVALQAIGDLGIAALIVAILYFVGAVVVFLRLGIAPALMLAGAGPVAALQGAWNLTRGHLLRVFRWLFVAAVLVGLASGLLSSIVGGIFQSLGLLPLGQVVAVALAAPFSLISAIVLIRLAQLLSSPEPPPPPTPALPDWMRPADPATPTDTPPVEGA